MKKLIFLISFGIVGSFGIASAQVEQSTTTTTTERQRTTYENKNDTTLPHMQGMKQDETVKKGLLKKKDHSTSEKDPKEKYNGSSGKGSATGSGSSTNIDQQGNGTSGTYKKETGTSGTYKQGIGTSGTYQQGTGTNGTYQQGTTTTPQDKIRTDTTYNQSMGMSQEDEGWTKIGEKTVNLSKDRDEVTISGSEKFSSIKIKLSDNAMIDLQDVEVEYEGGEKQTIELDIPINMTTGESSIIDLESSDQNVKKITFDYKKRATWTDNDKIDTKEIGDAIERGTKVEIWGLKADTALR